MSPGVLVYPRWPEKKERKEAPETNASPDTRRDLGGAREWRRRGNGDREREKKERKKERRQAGSAFSPRPPAKRGPPAFGTGARSRSARGETQPPTAATPPTRHPTPAWPRPGVGRGKRERGRAEARAPPFAGRKGRAGEGHTPSSGDGGETRTWWGAGARESPRRPPTTPHGRAGAGGCGRASGARPPRGDKPLCRGLTFNRSQRGSCSATYETPTQKQVVYEWFSARFHTNVR